ncbi:MAG TPA: acetate--CoA ligase family protein [Vicinamibacterales bacterium]|nr:acetate--CoA ligase family protein [Vicinamibacterales bacterium]
MPPDTVAPAPTPAATLVDSIRPLLQPRSIAIIGVSRSGRGIGCRVLAALRASGYPGEIFPITRDGAEVDGQRTWTSLAATGATPDLCVIAVPRDGVEAAIDDCIAGSVKAVVVVTAGFAETDDDGRALQDRLVAKVRAAGVRMVGPNCMGVVSADPAWPMNASFSPVFPPAGGLALSSQSGALGVVILDLATRREVGLSSFVSVGNKADVSSNDLLEYWASDPATSVIALYLESFGNPLRFAQIAREVGRRKPIIAVKAGRTKAGTAAAGSHTAALAASDIAVSALFHQTGVIRADTIDEMFDLAACLESQPLPRGARVAIVTNAGGPGILAADACEAAGLDVVPFGAGTRHRLAEILPSLSALGNPLDMIATADAAQYRDVITSVLAAEEVDAVLVLYTPVDASAAAPIIEAIRSGIAAGRNRADAGKPVLACLMADHRYARLTIGSEHVPVYAFPENAARALGKVVQYAKWRRLPPSGRPALLDIDTAAARSLCRDIVMRRGADWLTPEETRVVLDAVGLTLLSAVPAHSADEAADLAEAAGFPVVAKLHAPAGVHKTDLGGVAVDLRSREDVVAAYRSITERARSGGVTPLGVVIQPMVTDGVETFVGVAHDRLFGALVGFGCGGTEVELLGDVHFRVAPLTTRDIDELIHESRAFTLLAGHRGRPAADLAALTDLLTRVARLAEDVPEVFELDLNPMIVLPQGRGCRIVDVRIRVGEASSRPTRR